MNINDFINSLSNELIKNNFHYIEISKDFNRYDNSYLIYIINYKDKKENICIKSKINKLSNNKYELIIYDNDNKSIKSNNIYNEDDIKTLIKSYFFL